MGRTNDIVRRWIEHVTRDTQLVDREITKYGWEKFNLKILETAPVSELPSREVYWIKKLGTFNSNNYNLHKLR